MTRRRADPSGLEAWARASDGELVAAHRAARCLDEAAASLGLVPPKTDRDWRSFWRRVERFTAPHAEGESSMVLGSCLNFAPILFEGEQPSPKGSVPFYGPASQPRALTRNHQRTRRGRPSKQATKRLIQRMLRVVTANMADDAARAALTLARLVLVHEDARYWIAYFGTRSAGALAAKLKKVAR